MCDKFTQIGAETFPLLDLSAVPNLPELRSLCSRFDVVIANTLVMWAAVRAANEAGMPVIWYIHESRVARQLIAQIPEIQPTLELADIIVMPTHQTAALYAPFTRQTIAVVPYGIPPAHVLSEAARDATVTCFLLLGSYERRKGQDLFLHAVAQLPVAIGRKAIFQAAGRKLDGVFYETITRQAAALPNVCLYGPLEHDEALAATAAADVLVCASRDETMPIAILEAMSLGKAIIATNVGGIAECLRDGVDALLVPAEDSEALAHAIRRCVEAPGLINSLGKNACQTFSAQFSLDLLGERFTALIERALLEKQR
jgi:glycosyltransferase involved in cell wall biosynthesis